MATTAAATRHASDHDPLAGLDRWIEKVIGADFKLIYGVLMPMLLICGVILAIVFTQSVWVVAVTLVLELAFLAFIVVKLMAMLGEGEHEGS